MVILAVGAHPDDIEFGCFGTLKRFSEEDDIHLLIFTKGEISGDPSARIEEAKKSADLLGAELNILDFPDGGILHNSQSVSVFFDHIEKIKPDVMFTLYPFDTHQDHVNVSKITLAANRDINKILFYEVPQSINFDPNYYVNITEYFDLKKIALSYYISQNKKPFLNIEQIKGMAQYRAYKIFQPNYLFESFKIFKWVE